jgi:DNA/RNA endonuclease YhcR with UshA esterase domain
MLLRPFRALTLVLACAGLIALIWAARATPRATTSAGAITPAMNFAYVRVSGVVVDFPAVEPDGSYLSFRVADADGVIRAQAYRAAASALLAANAIPSPGDEAQIEGTLRIRDGEATLLVNSADGVVLTRRSADPIGLIGLEGLPLGQRVTVLGQIRRVREAGALRILTLRDGNAEADAVMSLEAPGAERETPPVLGGWALATGGVGEYRGRRQLLLMPGGLAPTPAPAPVPRPLSALNRALLGDWITTQARVSRLAPFKGGIRIGLAGDEGSELTMTLFDSVWTAMPFSSTLASGDLVVASGRLTEYRGALELQPEIAPDVVLARR